MAVPEGPPRSPERYLPEVLPPVPDSPDIFTQLCDNFVDLGFRFIEWNINRSLINKLFEGTVDILDLHINEIIQKINDSLNNLEQ